jgi:hypothetical protein
MCPSELSKSEWFYEHWQLTHDNVALLNLLQHAEKHRLNVEAAIVAEAVLVQIGLQVMTAHLVVNPTNPSFDEGPKALHGVGMNVSAHVDPLVVLNPAVLVAVFRVANAVINVPLVSKYRAFWHNVFTDNRQQGTTLNVVRSESADTALAFHDSEDRSLRIFDLSARVELSHAAEISLVHLDALAFAAQRWGFLIVEHGANLLEHAPGCFVGNASLPLNLFCRNAATGLRHEVDGIEPSGERSRRFVEDRASSRVNVMAAMVARVGGAAHYAMVLGDRFALVAIDAFRVQAIAKPLKAGCIIRKLFLEVFQCVRQHVRLAVIVRHLVTYSQVKSYQMIVPTVKG